jgi:hypothetical protein
MVEGYVALSGQELEEFQRSMQVSPWAFRQPGIRGEYIPLDWTIARALETAMGKCSLEVYEMAEGPTEWYVLKMSLGDAAIARAFKEGKLHWAACQHRLEWWAPILAKWLQEKSGDSPTLELIQQPMCQMDFDSWGDRVLSWQFGLHKWRQPATCEAEQCKNKRGLHHLWRAPKSSGAASYCAMCWHHHCKGAVTKAQETSQADQMDVESADLELQKWGDETLSKNFELEKKDCSMSDLTCQECNKHHRYLWRAPLSNDHFCAACWKEFPGLNTHTRARQSESETAGSSFDDSF